MIANAPYPTADVMIATAMNTAVTVFMVIVIFLSLNLLFCVYWCLFLCLNYKQLNRTKNGQSFCRFILLFFKFSHPKIDFYFAMLYNLSYKYGNDTICMKGGFHYEK